MSNFHELTISQVVQETDDCVTLYFDIPETLSDTFKFSSGQYLTLKTEINDNEIRRAYSICTAPWEPKLGVSVKQVKNGRMSTFLNHNVGSGDTMEVLPPDGKFVVRPDTFAEKTYYFFAAGSGITPVISMIKSIIEEEPRSVCHLLFGNRSEKSIIFKAQLDNMAKKYKGQVNIAHILSAPVKSRKKGLVGLFSKPQVTWQGLTGRIDKDVVKKWLSDNAHKTNEAEYYMCGPAGMISTVEETLTKMGIDKSSIFMEYFTAPKKKDSSSTVASVGIAKAEIILDGESKHIEIDKTKTVLDNLIQQNIDVSYSCTSGACSTCMAKVTEGSAEMEVCFSLDDSEVKDGYILTCQAKATSDKLTLNFDV